jgi:hypothetical protein
MATFTWVALLWAVAAAGRLVPAEVPAGVPETEPSVTSVPAEASISAQARGRAGVVR